MNRAAKRPAAPRRRALATSAGSGDAPPREVRERRAIRTDKADMSFTRERWMALFFAAGSACFLIGPFPGYAALVGSTPVAITFFVGSILFTIGGGLQLRLARAERSSPGARRAALATAAVQSAGTIFFNVSTGHALDTAPPQAVYDSLVWRPDAFGSICFLVSGAIAYRASARNGWRPAHDHAGWWEPSVNLVGCVLFGISAVAGYLVPSSGSILDLAAANLTTAAGAACFLACALATLRTGRTTKVPAVPACPRPRARRRARGRVERRRRCPARHPNRVMTRPATAPMLAPARIPDGE
jgi:hypothetical protein